MNSECYFIKTEQNKAKSQSFYIHIKLWQTVPLEMPFLLFCFTLPFYVETSLSPEQGQQTWGGQGANISYLGGTYVCPEHTANHPFVAGSVKGAWRSDRRKKQAPGRLSTAGRRGKLGPTQHSHQSLGKSHCCPMSRTWQWAPA